MIPSRTDLLGKQMPGDVITEKEADVLRYACWESYITWKSAAVLKEGLKEHGMEQLMREIEMPLVFVLSDMEQDGICIDANALKEYGQKLSVSIGELEQKIYEEAGETFNINSPKQLGVILSKRCSFRMEKDKDRFSTSAEVLENLPEIIRLLQIFWNTGNFPNSNLPMQMVCQTLLMQPENPYNVPSDDHGNRAIEQYRSESAEYPDPD